MDNAQSLSSALEQQLQDKQDEIESLKSRGVEDSVTKDSQEYRQKTSNQIQSLKQDNTKLRQKLKTSEEKRDIYEQQAKMFREWIQQKDIVPEIDDAVITVKFGKLIENIQRVILTSYKVSVALPTPEEADRPLVKELYSQFQLRLTPSELQNRIRGLVFYTLRNCILLQASFGLAYTEENIPIEYGLTEFEKLINEKPKSKCKRLKSLQSLSTDLSYVLVSTTKIAEWRTMTLGLAQALRPTEVAPNCCQNTAVEIMQALNPLEKHKHGEEKNKLRNHWEQLCTDAFELTMMLRSHKDAYRCEIPQEGQALSNEDAEAQASECTGRAENGTDSDELIAAYALSGALVRYPANDPGKRIVLQKALVIVKGPCK